jgi:hypothetical protein
MLSLQDPRYLARKLKLSSTFNPWRISSFLCTTLMYIIKFNCCMCVASVRLYRLTYKMFSYLRMASGSNWTLSPVYSISSISVFEELEEYPMCWCGTFFKSKTVAYMS